MQAVPASLVFKIDLQQEFHGDFHRDLSVGFPPKSAHERCKWATQLNLIQNLEPSSYWLTAHQPSFLRSTDQSRRFCPCSVPAVCLLQPLPCHHRRVLGFRRAEFMPGDLAARWAGYAVRVLQSRPFQRQKCLSGLLPGFLLWARPSISGSNPRHHQGPSHKHFHFAKR